MPPGMITSLRIARLLAARRTDMSYATDPVTIKSSHKQHRCDWCNTAIDVGTSYVRWRWYESGDASTVKSHLECLRAAQDYNFADEQCFNGSNPRGCNCDHEKDCKRCAEIKEILSGEPHH